jgi:ABC-type multidrug transport system permease subunit
VAQLFDDLLLLTSGPGRMAYSGPMDKAKAYFKECGYTVPMNVNPTDYYLDLLTPGTRLDRSDSLVGVFQEKPKHAIDAHVEAMMGVLGPTVKEMLSGDGGPVQLGPYAVPFGVQLGELLRRKVQITVRNPVALGLPLAVPVLQGLVVGYMFEGIGESPQLLRQIMFAFCMLTMLCLAGTMSLIVLITERTLMKFEASEALYCEGASALATFLVDVPLALLGALLNIFIMVTLARFEWDIFVTVLEWALLLFFVYDSLFAFIGAVAADTRQAQVIATPFISVFMLFNGFIVSKNDSPPPLHWIFDISPNAYAMQSIVVRLAENFPMDGPLLLGQFGYEGSEDTKGFTTLVVMIVLLRVGQQFGLTFLNNVQR